MDFAPQTSCCSGTNQSLHLVGLAVSAAGEASFPDDYFSALLSIADIDMVSAFAMEGTGKPAFLFARSVSSQQQEFAQLASQRYASAYWKNDPAFERLVQRTRHSSLPVVYQQCWSQIPASDYRSWAYEQPGVEDRISLTSQCADRQILVNLYRSSAKGAFAQTEVSRCADFAQLLTALVGKHARLADAHAAVPLHPSPESVEARMEKSFPLLSRRERQVCANVLMGMSVKEIARGRALELSSVITYKRRAYSKLEVSDRRGLARRYVNATN